MRIVLISDTHNKHDEVILPDGDILIHSGDATIMGTSPEIHDFSLWWNKLDFKYKIFVPGNHDWGWFVRRTLSDSLIRSVQDELIEIEGLRIYGSPWTPRYGEWAFMMNRGADIKRYWDQIPGDLDVLITHGPPHGILDEQRDGLNVGCRDLKNKVVASKPRLHTFGHIHEGYGLINDLNGVIYANASICGPTYRPRNSPHVIDL